MSRVGNFNDSGELEGLHETSDAPKVPSEEDKGKLEHFDGRELPEKKSPEMEQKPIDKQEASPKEKLTPQEVKGLSDDGKTEYYRSHGLDNLADNREAIKNNRQGEGITERPAEINSKNFDKISNTRNIEPGDAQELKSSFSKWSPQAQSDTTLRDDDVTVRHAPEGEKFQLTESDDKPASGIFVTKDMPGTSDERKRELALPQNNSAENVKEVETARPQDVIEGKVAPQPKFEGEDGIPREGGGIQTITDGGYGKKAIRDVPTKTPEIQEVNEQLTPMIGNYYQDLKDRSEYPETIPEKQFEAEDLKKLSPEEVEQRRDEFDDKKDDLKQQWSDDNGIPWPTYDENVISKSGKPIRKEGGDYDAHHIQPLSLGGENEASNITPMHASEHYDRQGIHAPDSPCSKLMKSEDIPKAESISNMDESSPETKKDGVFDRIGRLFNRLKDNDRESTEQTEIHPSKEWDGLEAIPPNDGKGWTILPGNNYEQYKKIEDNLDDHPRTAYQDSEQEVINIDPNDIEGIYLGDSEAENPSRFWSMHNGNKNDWLETASHIPEVRNRLENGENLENLLDDDRVGRCAQAYFNPNSPNAIRVDEMPNGGYLFNGDGRHRIIAARNQGYEIPVKIVGKRI